MTAFALLLSVFQALLNWGNRIFESSVGFSFVAVVTVGCVWVALLGFIFRIRLPGVKSEQVENPDYEEYRRMKH